ncbi:acyl carrier protein [Micromonosporaceae bacterium B7E4]
MTPDDERLRACTQLVAEAVADILEAAGRPGVAIADLRHDSTRSKDLTLLGLGSFELMRLAARLEDETGVELEDAVLLDPHRRCVAGWAACLHTAGALESVPDPTPR